MSSTVASPAVLPGMVGGIAKPPPQLPQLPSSVAGFVAPPPPVLGAARGPCASVPPPPSSLAGVRSQRLDRLVAPTAAAEARDSAAYKHDMHHELHCDLDTRAAL